MDWIPQEQRDTIERLIWTLLAVVLAEIPVWVADLDQWWVAPLVLFTNTVLIQLRKRAPWLPDPGQGLPGAPTEMGDVDG